MGFQSEGALLGDIVKEANGQVNLCFQLIFFFFTLLCSLNKVTFAVTDASFCLEYVYNPFIQSKAGPRIPRPESWVGTRILLVKCLFKCHYYRKICRERHISISRLKMIFSLTQQCTLKLLYYRPCPYYFGTHYINLYALPFNTSFNSPLN